MKLDSVEDLIATPRPDDMCLVIPSFNNPTYVRNTIDRFTRMGIDQIIILDNNSSYRGMRELIDEISQDHIVVAQNSNPGPRQFFFDQRIFSWLPKIFMVTDPDLEFKDALDLDGLHELAEKTVEYQAFKMGSALDIEMPERSVIDLPFNYNGVLVTIRQIEMRYYMEPVGKTSTDDTIYRAAIDTTFALHNKDYAREFMSQNFRVGGRFSAIHYGWYLNPPMPQVEYDYYKEMVKSSPYASTEIIRRGDNYSY